LKLDRADHVLRGPVVAAAAADRLEMAEAIGIADATVVAVGRADDVLAAARGGARVTDVRDAVVVPGLHDFHLHLAAMARARLALRLDEVATFDELLGAVRAAIPGMASGAWLTGRGWREAGIDQRRLGELEALLGGRPAALTSHDGHSLWASSAARDAAGIGAGSTDPSGGRIERGQDGTPNGLIREAALAPVDAVTPRPRDAALAPTLEDVIDELSRWGITSVTDAGDPDANRGAGPMAALGDSFSTLHDLATTITPRVRLTLNLPIDALGAAGDLGLRSGDALGNGLRVGWAKIYGDGALGSRTAAVFEPYQCGEGGNTGILRYAAEPLTDLVAQAHRVGIAPAIHAIGDRAVAVALDALGGNSSEHVALPDRIEHAQLIRRGELRKFAGANVTASVQPIHAVADRELVETCWRDRADDAYPIRVLLEAGARLAFGSDAPIENANPWLGFHAATRRHGPGDGREPWRPEQALPPAAALAGYTAWAAAAGGTPHLGQLRPGARADLAVLDTNVAALVAPDESVAGIRSRLTLIDGRVVHAD
jgi:predicted amidohydrolase YtcJ